MATICVSFQSLLLMRAPFPAATRLFHHCQASSSFRRNFPGRRQVTVAVQRSELHTQIYQDGYAVFGNFVDESELPGLVSEVERSSFLEGERGQLLRGLFGEALMEVKVGASFIQEPGFKCTDGATSPEPWWEHMWKVEKEDINNVAERRDSTFLTASLVVSFTGSRRKQFGGGFSVYPRSHWLVADWLKSSSEETTLSTLPKACDVPAAPVMELDLRCGDAVLLHPLLAWSLAPNISKWKTSFLFFNLYMESSKEKRCSGSEVMQIWHSWTSLTSQLTEGLAAFQSQEVEQMEEEFKGTRGDWTTSFQSGNLPELPFHCSYLAPRDRISWQLHSCATASMQKEHWEHAMVMLQHLAGLRPESYWVVYHAGRCGILSAPRGQLAGRSGRKSRLEDAERYLLRAIEMAPGWPLSYAELSQVLFLLGRGREKDIPEILQSMKMNCNVDQLSLKYPETYDALRQCQERCDKILSNLST